MNDCSPARTLVVELTFGLAGSFLRVIFPRPSDSSASSAAFGLAAPMRLVRFSSSSLELGRSDLHSDVFVDDASLQLVRFFLLFLIWNWTVHLVLNSSRNGENRDHAISNLQRNGENRGAFGRENREDFGRVSS